MDFGIYKRESLALQQYLEEVRAHPILGEADQYALALRMVGGDETARGALISANLRMSLDRAVDVYNRNPDRADLMELIQAGNSGLIRAAEKYDPFRIIPDTGEPVKYSTYAWDWVRSFIQREPPKQSVVKYPQIFTDIFVKTEQFRAEYIQEHNRDPSVEELRSLVSEYYESRSATSQPEIDKFFDYHYETRTTSLHNFVGDDDETEFIDLIVGEEEAITIDLVEYILLSERVDVLLGGLSERDRAIIRARYGMDDGLEKGPAAVGRLFNVTAERIRQIEARVLETLRRRGIGDPIIREFVDRV